MLDIRAKYSTSPVLENKGTWRELGDGGSVLVARTGNRAYQKLLGNLLKVHKEALDLNDEAAEDLFDKIVGEVFAKTILLGWKGIGAGGVEIPYSVEEAEALLAIKDFRQQIEKLANDVTAYKLKEEAAQKEA